MAREKAMQQDGGKRAVLSGIASGVCAEMLLADDTSLFRQGLKPKFPVFLPVQAKRLLFGANGRREPLKKTIFDQSR